MGHPPGAEAECPTSTGTGETGGTQTQKSKPCPIANPLQGKGSEQVDTSETYPRVREERSEAELAHLMEEAARLWD
jgi:hypothetical protein